MAEKSKTNQLLDGLMNPQLDTPEPAIDSYEFGITERIYRDTQTSVRARPDNLSTGEYFGVVLRVEGNTISSPSDQYMSTPQSAMAQGVLQGQRHNGPNLVQLKVRIPKFHSYMPIPETNPSIYQSFSNSDQSMMSDSQIIDAYPLFLAKEEDMDIPAAGDWVWVKFHDPNNIAAGGIYTGIYKKAGYITDFEKTRSPKDAYDYSCPGVLQTVGPAFPTQPLFYGTTDQVGSAKLMGVNPENIVTNTSKTYSNSLKPPSKQNKGWEDKSNICIGKQIAGYTTTESDISSTAGGYQSYKSVPTKVEIFTATPIVPPGWKMGSVSSKRPQGLLENRVRKFAFDALPEESAVRLPEGGVLVHPLLAKRVNAMNKFWTSTVLDKTSADDQKKRKITGIWNSIGKQRGLRTQEYNNNYHIYEMKMLLGKHTGAGNNQAYPSMGMARARKAFQSAHETGLGIDFTTNGQHTRNSSDQRERMNNWSWQWLINHAWLFGLTPYSEETWHWEFLPTRQAWETSVDFVDENDPTSGIWIGQLPKSQEQLSKLYKKNPLLKEAVAMDVPIYETIPYSDIGISGFGSISNDPLYVLNNPSEPIHFPYAVFVREILVDESVDHGLATSDARWTYDHGNKDHTTKLKGKEEVKIYVGKPYVVTEDDLKKSMFSGYEAGQEYMSSKYKKYYAGKQLGQALTLSVRRQRISKKIYFGWSGNNE